MKEHYEISEDEIKSCIDKAGGLTYDDKDQITEALQKLCNQPIKRQNGVKYMKCSKCGYDYPARDKMSLLWRAK